MTVARDRVLTDEEFEQLALSDPDGRWELWDGTPRRKPGMTFEHNAVGEYLSHLLQSQLDRKNFQVRSNKGHVRRPHGRYFIPDLFVIPAPAMAGKRGRPDRLESYTEPLPLVVEIWSRSTGRYDVTKKLDEYKRRGDEEIWLIHRYERTLTAWRRRPDGSYAETTFPGAGQRIGLPRVAVDVGSLCG